MSKKPMRKKRKKRKKVKKNYTLNKTKNVATIVYFIIGSIAMIFVILWYLNIYRI